MSEPPPQTPPDAAAQARELPLAFRSVIGAPPPRRIRLAIPGWAGASSQSGDDAPAMPWHCQPFVEGATYGLELIYPYAAECRVTRAESGGAHFEGDFTEMMAGGLPHPFGVFARGHYGMSTALDLLPPPGYALRLGPHPRYFTDETGEVPLALPGHLQRFWPRQFFAVFKVPPHGTVHVFRPGEPYAQLLLIPTETQYRIEPMDAELVQDRANQDRQITVLGYLLSKRIWRSDLGHWFDDKYKRLQRLFRRRGLEAVRDHLESVESRTRRP
jgi:hypothetical protein